MIEKIIIDYLNEKLDVPVYAEVPADDDGRFVVIEKTGSGRVNRLDSATIAVQSYADTMLDAAALNQVAKGYMLALPGESMDVSAVRLDTDYNFTDTETRKYRYQGVFVVTYYE